MNNVGNLVNLLLILYPIKLLLLMTWEFYDIQDFEIMCKKNKKQKYTDMVIKPKSLKSWPLS